MIINSINQNQSFGRLKITATRAGKALREKVLANAPSKIFDKIDMLSGNIPVEIRFDSGLHLISAKRYNIAESFINKKLLQYADVNKVSMEDFLKNIKEEVGKLTAKKYFA